MKTEAQTLLEIHIQELGFGFQEEFQFHPKRKWRFDYILIELPVNSNIGVAVEIEGGIFQNGRRGSGEGSGRHTRGTGYLKDLEKYREAAALNYKVYRFSPQEVLNGTALEFLKQHVRKNDNRR